MKLTPLLETKLQDLLLKYCKQIGFKRIPLVVLRKEDLPTRGLKISVSLSFKHDKECLGICYPSIGRKPDCIFIDVDRHKNWKQLENTLVHELVHSRFKWYFTGDHPKEFYQRIKDILRGKKF